MKSDLLHVKANHEDLVLKHRSVARATESQIMEEIMEVMPLMPQERTQEHIDDEIIDMPAPMQGQVLASQTVQRTVEVPQVQFLNRVVDVSVVTQRQSATSIVCHQNKSESALLERPLTFLFHM